MRKVTTTYTCERCAEVAEFTGDHEALPSLWSILRVDDQGGFRYLTVLLCLACRHDLEKWMGDGAL